MRPTIKLSLLGCVLAPLFVSSAAAQQRPGAAPPPAAQRGIANEPAPGDPTVAPARHEGDGPFPRLIIRGATLIDGTGGPPRGPVDIVIEGNQITQVASVGYPGVRID